MEPKIEESCGEMKQGDSSGKKQCTVLHKLEECVDVMQSLIKRHGEQQQQDILEERGNHYIINNECRNSPSVLAIAVHIENILKIINEEKSSLQQTQELPSSQTTVDQLDETSVDDSGAREKALNNSVVLRTIMKNFDAPQLLSIRLVSKKWEEEATIQLLSSSRTNAFYKITFSRGAGESQFRNKMGTLEEFTESCCSKPLKKFPCTQFDFRDGALEFKIPADLSNFMIKNGHHIKIMRLLMFSQSPCVFKIIKQILGSTPRLQSFTLDFLVYDCPKTQGIEDRSQLTDADATESTPIYLEDLQELIFAMNVNERSKVLVKEILSAAPNLKRISDPRLMFTEEIVSSGKIGSFHDLYCSDCSGSSIMVSRFMDLSNAFPKLTSLKLEVDCFSRESLNPSNDFAISLHRILESSRLTLKTLHLAGRLDLDTEEFQMNIPIMENMEELRLYQWSLIRGGQGRILPVGSSLQISFPRLKILSVEGVQPYAGEGPEDNAFGCDCNSSTTVERLSIIPDPRYYMDPEWISQAYSLYPNVRTLQLEVQCSWDELDYICRQVWYSWEESSLEQLHINLEHIEDFSMTPYLAQSMDSALTGFDDETCRMLRKRRCSHADEQSDRNVGITEMSNLKLFQITGKPPGGFPIFSRVALIHAILPMRERQNLRVVVNGVELEEMIREGPTVDFEGVF